MNIKLWTPLKITSPLLQDIFNLSIDGKDKMQSHPIIVLENEKDDTYYCIRMQTLKYLKEDEIQIHNNKYQKNEYWAKTKSVVITKDIFIIDKALLEQNIDLDVYNNTNALNADDRELIVDDLEKRINSTPPNLNILKISNNLKNNLVLYTSNDLIKAQLNSTLGSSDYRIKQSTKNYYKYHFDKDQFLSGINTSNIKKTQEALKNIKLCVNKEKGLKCKNDFEYKLNKKTNEYYLAKKRILKP